MKIAFHPAALIELAEAVDFPFLLPYTVGEDGVVLLAVAHAKRKPGYWRERTDDL